MKKLILVSIALNISFALFGQEEKKFVENLHSAKLTFLGVSYGYEHAIFPQSTINAELSLLGGFGSNFIDGDYWIIAPVIRVEPRYYYNYYKRFLKGKKMDNNSANYLSISTDYQFGYSIGKNATVQEYLTIIPKWGIRRNILKFLYFEGAIGFGAYIQKYYGAEYGLGLDLKFGFALSK